MLFGICMALKLLFISSKNVKLRVAEVHKYLPNNRCSSLEHFYTGDNRV